MSATLSALIRALPAASESSPASGAGESAASPRQATAPEGPAKPHATCRSSTSSPARRTSQRSPRRPSRQRDTGAGTRGTEGSFVITKSGGRPSSPCATNQTRSSKTPPADTSPRRAAAPGSPPWLSARASASVKSRTRSSADSGGPSAADTTRATAQRPAASRSRKNALRGGAASERRARTAPAAFPAGKAHGRGVRPRADAVREKLLRARFARRERDERRSDDAAQPELVRPVPHDDGASARGPVEVPAGGRRVVLDRAERVGGGEAAGARGANVVHDRPERRLADGGRPGSRRPRGPRRACAGPRGGGPARPRARGRRASRAAPRARSRRSAGGPVPRPCAGS